MISIITPTLGRETLRQTVDSARDVEWAPTDEWWIVGDAHAQLPAWLDEYVLGLGHPFKYFAYDAGRHEWGHPQRNVAIERARKGNYLVWQDDTDTFFPGALTDLHDSLPEEQVPFLVSFKIANAMYSCENPVSVGCVGGHQFVTPNIPGKVGLWSDRYEGDFDFIESTLAHWEHFLRIPIVLTQAA